MSDKAHEQVVQRQFGEQAAAYLSSAVHAQGVEFALLQAEVAGCGDARVLDLGCGAGHVAFRWSVRSSLTISPRRCSK